MPLDVRAERIALNLSQAALARELGVSPNTVARWERGELRMRNPSLVAAVLARLKGHAEQALDPPVGEAPPGGAWPRPTTPLLGRERVLRDVHGLLSRREIRLLTLVGPGGVGKTRVAVEVLQQLRDVHGGRAYFVDLAPVTETALVGAAIARALGAREEAERPLLEVLVRQIGERSLLLVLDNCEHVLDATALFAELLRGCPGLRLLATSREPLRIAGEQEYHVPPLEVGARLGRLPVDRVLEAPAVALFVDRAQATHTDFELLQRDAPAVVEICRRLDGLPLAIEIVAPWTRVLSPSEIAERLARRMFELDRENRGGPAHQRSLHGVLDWSYDLLGEAERVVFRRLSVFSGGWTLAAAETVCAGDGIARGDIVRCLAQLVDRSLVVSESGSGSDRRFRFLEIPRQYAAERLLASGEASSIERAHASFFVGLAEHAKGHLTGAQQSRWLDELEREQDNLRATLTNARARGDQATILRLGAALWRFWWLRGYLVEGRRFLGPALERMDSSVALRVRAEALQADANLARLQGEYDSARQRALESLALFQRAGETTGVSLVSLTLGNVAFDQGEYTAASDWYGSALSSATAIGDTRVQAMALRNLAAAARAQGDGASARVKASESLRLFEQAGDTWGLALATDDLAALAAEAGDHDAAGRLYRASLRYFRDLGDKWSMSEALESLGRLALASQQLRRAARWLATSHATREAIGSSIRPNDLPSHTAAVATLRTALGKAEFDLAWNTGLHTPLEDAVADVLATEDGDPMPGPVGTLSRREWEVAELVGRGWTNRQIAEQLIVSERTIETHVSSALRKLALDTRTQLAVWANAHHRETGHGTL